MNAAGWIQIAVFVAALTGLTPVLGAYMARVFRGEPIFLERALRPVERASIRFFGPAARAEQDWKAYARSAIVFSAVSWLGLYLMLRTQSALPWNPEGFGAGPWDLTFNTASSFVSNTNWQYYGGETTLSYFSQMAGLTVQNFLSAAVGIAVAVALIRAIAARGGNSLGNFYSDVTRAVLYILLPVSAVLAVFFVSQGVIQDLSSYLRVDTLIGGEQTLALGPVASQESIKILGTNGGGFFNVNSAMPYENPSGLTNFVQLLLILAIPAALTATFGRMVGSRRQGWALYAAMAVMFVAAVAIVYAAEGHGSVAQHAAGLGGGNLEGKEQRFGVGGSSLYAVATTVASCGAVNAAMESMTGLGATVPLANILTGEVIFGGVGSGLYGMLLFVLLAVFIAGLMVGRTPEYLGKKIGSREIKLTVFGTLIAPLLVLGSTALATALPAGRESIVGPGPQGFTETLYAYASQGNNNGSAFAGYTGFIQPQPGNAGSSGVTFADILGGFVMLGGRFLPMLAVLAVAGALVSKPVTAPGPGTMRTDSPVFVGLLIGTILLVALLTFVPALLLGPLVQALSGDLF